MAGDRDQFEAQALSGLMEMAVRNVRQRLRTQNFDCSSEELQNAIERNELECKILAAHHDGEAPRIHTISLTLGLVSRAKSFFEAVGSGADLASYLLTELCSPRLDCRTASVIAAHVVETVKRHDPYCGGPTMLGILWLPKQKALRDPIEAAFPGLALARQFYSPPIVLSRKDTDEIVQMVLEVETATKEKRAEIIRDALRKGSEARLKQILSQLDGP